MEYYPGKVPQKPEEIPAFLANEFRRMSQVLAAAHKSYDLVELHAEPEKRKKGMVVLADGTDWQPNGTGGAGIWYYNGATWIQLG